MMLRYDVPVKVQPDPPKGTEVKCTRITIYPDTGKADYEYQVFDTDGVKVADLHRSGTVSKELHDPICTEAYALVQADLGAGALELGVVP